MKGNNLVKKNGSRRSIEKPTEEEKESQREILDKLTPEIYSDFEDFVYGIPGKGQHNAIEKFEEYREDGYQWIANLDVKHCYDSINPKDVLRLIDYNFEDIPEIAERDDLPTGHPLSTLLANVYLNQLDKKIASWPENRCKIIRWMDDIWLMSKTKREVIAYAYSLDTLAQDLRLELDIDSRMEVRHVNQGVEILGFTVYRWTRCPSPRNIRKQKERVMHLLNGIMMALRNSDLDSASEMRDSLTDGNRNWSQYFDHTTNPMDSLIPPVDLTLQCNIGL